MNIILRIARKELAVFFSSPAAFIFFGAFLSVTLFVFFWVETFFANNIAEVRPLFEWMPILLIFLSAAVTMRLWAEERRAGTLEFLLASPVSPLNLVLGKFFGCLALIVISLFLTLPLPITVSFIGPLDWGPVFGGYLAALFLAAAYIAIGLYVSVKSENQIVSLIVSTLVCTAFYLLGADILTSFLGNKGAEILKLLGSGSRFDSITRGVIDFRDLYYYLGLMGVFLTLNVYGLEKIRWAGNPTNKKHRVWQLASGLLIVNFLIANFWLAPIGFLRTDITRGDIYSISESTKTYLGQLKEPLLIRGYFSEQTHPLLAPLVPRVRDLLEEYSVAGGSTVRVEFIDPLKNPQLEQEAGQKYGIKPVPFQTTSKYSASVTNSYFDILIKYGDQYEVLGFRDLIEIKVQNQEDFDVELRNPEYDITRAIKKVLYSYQGGGDLFANISKPVSFNAYVSADDKLPQQLIILKKDLDEILKNMQQKGKGNFSSIVQDPDDGNGQVAEQIANDYGFRQMAASLLDEQTFWFYMTLTSGDQVVEIPLPQDLTSESLKRSIDAGLKRFAVGFTKAVALHTPKGTPPMPQYGIPGKGKHFNMLREILSQDHTVKDADLENGRVPEEAELLVVASPDNLDQKQLFAVDQFLMQGGTVVLATSPFDVEMNRSLGVKKHKSGLEDWLAFHGIKIDETMVLDPQNSAFPVPVQRNLGGFTVQETKLVSYPYFVDIRSDAMNQDSGMVSGLNQVTLNWASPINIDQEINKERKFVPLLESSSRSWLSAETNIQPDFNSHGELGFALGDKQGKHVLGLMVEGRFTSYFKGKESPLLQKDTEADLEKNKSPGNETAVTEGEAIAEEEKEEQIISRMIDKSPESARIIVFASNTFLTDTLLGIGSSVMRTDYLGPVQLAANAVDWSLEDRGLLGMRGRSHFSRPLVSLTEGMQIFVEYLNYGLALLGLLSVWLLKTFFIKQNQKRQNLLLQQNVGRI